MTLPYCILALNQLLQSKKLNPESLFLQHILNTALLTLDIAAKL